MDANELLNLLGYSGPAPQPAGPPQDPGGIVDPFADPGAAPDLGLVDPFQAAGPSIPDQAPPQAVPQGRPMPAPGTSVSAGQSQSGFSPTKYEQVKRATSGVEGQIADARNRAEQRYAGVQAGYAGAVQEARAAEDQLAVAESAKIKATSEHAARRATMEADFERDSRQAWADAQVAANQAKAEYQAKLLEIPSMNPSELWDAAGAAGQFQMGAAAFMHDFLGAKGIKTSAMDTINGAIKRNIDGQIANINNKKDVAQGFKNLWQMTLEQSNSEAEARARMHTYALASMSAQLDAQMGSYDSNLAAAKHAAAKAKLTEALQDNALKVEKYIDDAAAHEASQIVTLNGQRTQAAIARLDANTRLQVAQLAADKNSGGTPAAIPDLTKSGGGLFKWRFKPQYAVDKELTRDVTKKVIATTQAVEAMRELMDLQNQMAKAAPDVLGRLRSEQTRLESAVRNRVKNALILEQTGKAVNEAELKRIDQLLPEKDWFTNGTNRRIVSELLSSKIKETDDTLATYTNPIVQGDPEFGTRASQGNYAPGELAEAQIIRAGDQREETAKDKVQQLSATPDAFRPAEGATSEARGDWGAYMTSHGLSKEDVLRQRKTGGARAQDLLDLTTPDNTFVQIHELGRKAMGGDDAAMSDLVDLATRAGKPNGVTNPITGEQGTTSLTDSQTLAKDYALWELAQIRGR